MTSKPTPEITVNSILRDFLLESTLLTESFTFNDLVRAVKKVDKTFKSEPRQLEALKRLHSHLVFQRINVRQKVSDHINSFVLQPVSLNGTSLPDLSDLDERDSVEPAHPASRLKSRLTIIPERGVMSLNEVTDILEEREEELSDEIKALQETLEELRGKMNDALERLDEVKIPEYSQVEALGKLVRQESTPSLEQADER